MNGTQSTHRGELRSEAAHWYNQHLAGDMTLEDEYRFRDWINRSDAHRGAYKEIDRAWYVAGTTASDLARSDDPVPARVGSSRSKVFAAVASILLVAGIGWLSLGGLPFGERDHPAQAFQTETGQRATVTLPDGSIVLLDSETDMRFMDLPDERRVRLLRGRAYFEVASDSSRPFVVHAAGKTVRAIGTAFEVSMAHGELTVVLVEGKVRVEDATETENGTDMTPGRQLVIDTDRRWTLTNADVEKEIGWTEGRLIFMHDPLSEAVAEVNRYSTRKLTFKDGTIPDREIVGVFTAGDVDGFIKALELNRVAKQVSSTNDEIELAEY